MNLEEQEEIKALIQKCWEIDRKNAEIRHYEKLRKHYTKPLKRVECKLKKLVK